MTSSAGIRRRRRRRAQVAALGAAVVALVALVVVVATRPGEPAGDAEATGDGPVLQVFHLDTCPHCRAALAWLPTLEAAHPTLQVELHEVSDPAAQARFAEVTAALGVPADGVPTIVLGDRHWVGFSERVAAQVEEAVAAATSAVQTGPSPAPAEGVAGSSPPAVDPADTVVDVPVVGEVDVAGAPLLASTALLALLDGFNPCSLWVLSVLLALVLHSGSRGRVLAVGGTFLVVTTALYGIYVVGLMSVMAYLAYATWVRLAVAVVAAGMGVVNLKDWWAFGKGPSLTIAESRKPGLVRRMRDLARSQGSGWSLLGATVVLATGVSLLETPCTIGLPMVWTSLLATHEVGWGVAAGLFALYWVIFLADELLVFGAAVLTMRAAKVQERHGRALKLVTGLVMVALAGAMLLRPELLTSVTGTTALFGGAGVVGAAILLAERGRRGGRRLPVVGGRHRPSGA